ncbi:Gfo/Idh/MocA family oxidoreductase [Streptomyces sp. GMY02]|uniref:Gfo/Idh/MocA family protein n=1 Tax=Streptomyces sp. GMY02 TaxID=1333528 RepID=UPI001C2CA3E9|nr:Gfo/Idh/MocA family oxidoreductase [Streptomyces sp. GMY02]QXE33858.1 Gfo/Idh/MocA family oxidoreductase [Streptomyces sp. GMY02]
MIRVGVIGASPDRGWAAGAHIPAVRALPDQFQLTAVATSNADSARRASEAFGVDHAFADYRQLVEHPEVDLVVVSVKVPAHFELVDAAIAAGKHVYCEWPLAVTTEQAVHLADAADAQGVRTAIGLQVRFTPAVAHAAEVIAAGRIGRVSSITAHITGAKRGLTSIPQWVSYTLDRSNGAGQLEISGGHILDVVRFLIGPITVRPALTAIAFPQHTIAETGQIVDATSPDQVVITGTSASGATVAASVHGNAAGPSRARIEISGTDGELIIETAPTDSPTGASLQINPLRMRAIRSGDTAWHDAALPAWHGRPEWAGLPNAALNVARLYQQFAEDLSTGSRVVPDFRAAVEVHRLLDAARQDG